MGWCLSGCGRLLLSPWLAVPGSRGVGGVVVEGNEFPACLLSARLAWDWGSAPRVKRPVGKPPKLPERKSWLWKGRGMLQIHSPFSTKPKVLKRLSCLVLVLLVTRALCLGLGSVSLAYCFLGDGAASGNVLRAEHAHPHPQASDTPGWSLGRPV